MVEPLQGRGVHPCGADHNSGCANFVVPSQTERRIPDLPRGGLRCLEPAQCICSAQSGAIHDSRAPVVVQQHSSSYQWRDETCFKFQYSRWPISEPHRMTKTLPTNGPSCTVTPLWNKLRSNPYHSSAGIGRCIFAYTDSVVPFLFLFFHFFDFVFNLDTQISIMTLFVSILPFLIGPQGGGTYLTRSPSSQVGHQLRGWNPESLWQSSTRWSIASTMD